MQQPLWPHDLKDPEVIDAAVQTIIIPDKPPEIYSYEDYLDSIGADDPVTSSGVGNPPEESSKEAAAENNKPCAGNDPNGTCSGVGNPPEESLKKAAAENNEPCAGNDPNRNDEALPGTCSGSENRPEESSKEATAENMDQALPSFCSESIRDELKERYDSYCTVKTSAFEVFLLKKVLEHPVLNHVLFCKFMDEGFFRENYFTLNVSLNGKIKECHRFPLDLQLLKDLDVLTMTRLCNEWFLQNKDMLFFDIKEENNRKKKKRKKKKIEETVKLVEFWMIIKEIKYYSITNVTTAYYFLNSDMHKMISLKDAESEDAEDTIKINSKGVQDRINIVCKQPNLTTSGENRDSEIISDPLKRKLFQVSDNYILPDIERDPTSYLHQRIKNKLKKIISEEEARLKEEKAKDEENEQMIVDEDGSALHNDQLENIISKDIDVQPENLEQGFEGKELDNEFMIVDEDGSVLHNDKLENIISKDIDVQPKNLEQGFGEDELDNELEEITRLIRNLPLEKPSTEIILLVHESLRIRDEKDYIDASVLDERGYVKNACESDSRDVLEGILDKIVLDEMNDVENARESDSREVLEGILDKIVQEEVEDTRKARKIADKDKPSPNLTEINAQIDLSKKKAKEREEIYRKAKTQAKLDRRAALMCYREFINKSWDAKLKEAKFRIQKQNRDMLMAARNKELEEKHRIQKQNRDMLMAAWDKELEEQTTEFKKRKNRYALPASKRVRIQ